MQFPPLYRQTSAQTFSLNIIEEYQPQYNC
jgi:hypothetical protein